jgi:hypothetical protein
MGVMGFLFLNQMLLGGYLHDILPPNVKLMPFVGKFMFEGLP